SSRARRRTLCSSHKKILVLAGRGFVSPDPEDSHPRAWDQRLIASAAAAAEAAATTTAAAAATPAAEATASAAFGLGSRFIDRQGAAFHFLAVHGCDGRLGLLVAAHFDETEPLGSTRVPVHDHLCGL